MPYKVVGNCVHKLNADGSLGAVVPGGCHDTTAQAQAHARALYANVEDVKTKEVRPPNLRHADSAMACAHCAYYMGEAQGTCKAYNQYPVDANDTCDAWEDKLSGVGTKDVSAVASSTGLHGPSSLLGIEGMGSDRKKRVASNLEVKMADSEGHGGFLVTEPDGTTHLPTRKNGKLDHGLMGAAWAALHGGYRGKPYGGPNKSGAISKLTALYKSEGIPTPSEEKSKTKGIDPYSALSQFKQPDGKWRWVLTTSSGFSDRDGETIPTDLLMQDSIRMKATGDYGPLRWQHVGSENANPLTRDPGQGLDIGICDYSEMHGHTQVESGTYYHESIGDAFQTQLKSLGGSKGYFYASIDPDPTGTYRKPIWGFERSILPRESASNWMATALKNLLHKEADVNETAVKALKDKLGPENAHLVDDLLKGIDQKEATLMQAGVGVKAKKDEPKSEQKDDTGKSESKKEEMMDEEESETPADEKKESPAKQAMEEKMGVEKHKTKEVETAELVASISDAIALKMQGTYVTPAMLDAKFAELTATRTKEVDETKSAIKAISDRLAVLEGDTPDSKRGMKASSSAATVVDHPLMRAALEQLAQSQGLTEALGLKATPQDDFTRLAQRMTSHLPNAGTNGQ